MDRPRLQEALGYSFHRAALLEQALTHRSFGVPHNERLEYLGDSVLNCVIAAALYDHFPALKEGELSRLRANLVREQTLHELALQLGVGEALKLGEGESRSGGHARPSILADAVEAIFGAVFLDGGFEPARQVILGLFRPLVEAIDLQKPAKDPKTQLQELLQGQGRPLPRYTVLATRGAAHHQTFEVECVISDCALRTTGTGNSRRVAEQAAAREAYEQLSR